MSIPNLSKKEFDFVQKSVPMICVDLIVKNNNKVLLGKRNTYPYKGLWHIPGGLIHYNETIKDALNRVAKRETGLEIEPIKQLSFHEYINEDPRGHFIGINYIVKKIGGNLKINEFNSELKYFNYIPDNMNPWQIDIVKHVLYGEF